MRTASSPALFAQPAPTNLTAIPTFAMRREAQANSIMDHYIFGRSSLSGHVDAKEVLQTLFNLGADLINSGRAYSQSKMTTESGEPKTPVQEAMTRLLMEKYNSLQKLQHTLGNQIANNSLHALFVIRVALDHLSPQNIYMMYTAFKINFHNAPLQPNLISFANGSGFIGSFAGEQVLRAYIAMNLKRFEFLSSSDKVGLLKIDHTSYLCLASRADIGIINKMLNDDLRREMGSLLVQQVWTVRGVK